MKRRIVIRINVPDSMQGKAGWTKEQCLEDYISHWLEEGYYTDEGQVNLPEGIEYLGYEIEEDK